MRDGAFDYLTKPFDFPALLATVERAVKQRSLAQALTTPPPPPARSGLVGTSTAMLAIWKLIGRAAASDAPVLITGETGTGKELVARAVHDYSTRAAAPFVAVNLAALPPTLLESELFGHERGAFTGAAQRRSGRIEAAGPGTLFLDEIGDVDPALQTKLLRVLADGSYERVGGDEAQTAKARIVSATHKPVRPGDAGSVLRDDLYYRLAVIEIEVPPLRARKSTSRCSSPTRSPPRRRAPSAKRRWRCCSPTAGPATCASSSTSSSAPRRCAPARSSTSPTCPSRSAIRANGPRPRARPATRA